jgi:hypothetical protein
MTWGFHGSDYEDGCLLGSSTVMVEAVQTSETSANSYQSTQCYNPEGSHLYRILMWPRSTPQTQKNLLKPKKSESVFVKPSLPPSMRKLQKCGKATLPYYLLTSFLIRGNQIGETSKLGWLTELVKQAIWAAVLYFTYLLLLPICRILTLFQLIWRPSSNPCWASLDFSRRPSFRLCLCPSNMYG